MRDRVIHAIAALGSVLALDANAQSCSFVHRLQYSDGAFGCIGDLPFSREVPLGLAGDVESTVPPSTAYSVAVASRQSGCPTVVAMVINKWPNANATAYNSNKTPEDRSRSAIEQCQRAVATSTSNSAACPCQVVIVDGRVTSSRSELMSFLGK